MTDTLEGLLRIEPSGLTFQPCDAAAPSWVVEGPGADLRSAAAGFSVGGGDPLLARVLGESVIPPGEGPGAAYADAIRVVQWVYLAEDTSGCEGAVASIIPAEAQPEGEGMPSFPPGTWLRALGNEPFWNVTVGVEGVRVSRLGFDDIAFPVSGPTVESGTRIWSGESAGHRFELAIREDRCADTMADRTYPFTAVLMLDGTEYQGCALESPEEVM